MRFFRILLSTIFCAILFITVSYGCQKFDEIESVFEPIGAALFLLLFLNLFSFVWILALTLVHGIMDARGWRRVGPYALLWASNTLLIAIVAPGPSLVDAGVVIPFSGLIGVLYWALAGRLAGQPETLLNGFSGWSLMTQVSLGIGLVLAALALRWIIFASLRIIGPM